MFLKSFRKSAAFFRLSKFTLCFWIFTRVGFWVYFFILLIPLPLIFLVYHACQKHSSKIILSSLFLRVIALTTIIFITTTDTFVCYHKKIFNDVVWSQENTIRENGRFSSFIYYGYKEKNYVSLKKYALPSADIV